MDHKAMGQIKQAFQNLGSALESGNLTDAKAALTDLQKAAPQKGGPANDPMAAKVETLSKAIDAGDLKGAQTAFEDIKKSVPKKPQGMGGPGGPPPGGRRPEGSGPTSGASKTSSSTKTYDKMDANQDGKVSQQEELDYSLTHQSDSTSTSSTSIDLMA